MSILVSDTLKPRGDGGFPVAEAKDVHVDLDNTNLETALEPATDIKLGRVKIGNNIDVNPDGEISITNRVSIGKDVPTDNSTLWLDTNNKTDIETISDDGTPQIVRVSKEDNNSIVLADDGLFALDGHTTRPNINPYGWKFQLDGCLYYKGYNLALTKTINYYVDSNGDDIYGDGTPENPRKTLGALPRNLNGYGINIYVSGNYYALKQDFNITGFYGGYINIYMVGNPSFWKMQFYNNAARIYVRDSFSCSISGMATTNLNGWQNALYIGGCRLVYITATTTTAESATITATGNGTGSFTATTGQTNCRFRAAFIESSGVHSDSRVKFIAKNAYQGFVAHNGARVGIDRLYPQSNTYGLVVGYTKMMCSVLSFSSNTNNYSIYSGGRYYTGSQSSVGRY